MQGEDHARQPSAGEREAADDQDDEAGGEGVLREVGEVVTKDGVAPQAVFDPEGAVQQRVILLGGVEREPDAPESVEGLEGWGGDMRGIVPKEGAAESRPVGQENGGGDGEKRRGGEGAIFDVATRVRGGAAAAFMAETSPFAGCFGPAGRWG